MKIRGTVKETLKQVTMQRYFAVIACLFSFLFGMIQPYYLGKLLDQAESSVEVITTLCIIILVLLVSDFLLNWLQNFFWFKMIYKGIYLVRKRLFKEVVHQNYEYITKNSCGDIVSRLINDSSIYAEKQLITMPMLLINVSTLVVIFCVISFLNLYIAWILFLISILYFASYRFFDKKLRECARQSGEDSSKMLHTANRLYEGISTIKLFGKEPFFEKKFEGSIKEKISIVCGGKKMAVAVAGIVLFYCRSSACSFYHGRNLFCFHWKMYHGSNLYDIYLYWLYRRAYSESDRF